MARKESHWKRLEFSDRVQFNLTCSSQTPRRVGPVRHLSIEEATRNFRAPKDKFR